MRIVFRTQTFHKSSIFFAILCGCGIQTFAQTAASQREILLLQQFTEGAQPLPLTSLGSVVGARKVSVPESGGHVLVLTEEGRVFAWGDNRNGQLGASNSTTHAGWVAVESVEQVSALAAGSLHSVALKNDGTVWTWGANHQGQLGNGTLADRATPGVVPKLSNVSMIAAGSVFTLALRSDGTVWGFGANWSEIVPGEGARVISEPAQVQSLQAIEAIAVYQDRGYARNGEGRIWTWGKSNESDTEFALRELTTSDIADFGGRLANLLSPGVETPVVEGKWHGEPLRVSSSLVELSGIHYNVDGSVIDVNVGWAVAIIAAPSESVGVDRSATTQSKTSVENQSRREALTIGPSMSTTSPAAVISPYALAAAETHGIALQANGTACSFGENGNGQLGDGTVVDRFVPVPVTGLSSLIGVATSWYHSVAVKNDGTVWTWGYNSNGQLGDGTTQNKPTPIKVNITGAIAVAAGQYHTLALKGDGTVWAWGYNGSGRIGDGTSTQRNTPVQVVGLTNVIAIAAGQNHSMALKSDGTVWTWGNNNWGALGDGTTTDRPSPVQVNGLTSVTRIAAGALHSIALRSNGTVVTWGYNGYGNLGDGTTTYRPAIVTVNGMSNAAAIAAGEYHSLVVKTDGTVWAWGRNANGQLGDASTTQRLVPVQVSGLTGGTAVAGGSTHSIALKSDGKMWAWGDNGVGQLGNGTTDDSSVPVLSSSCAAPPPPPPPPSPWIRRIAASQTHSLAVKPDGTLWAWGRNEYGELGDGTSIDRSAPVQAAISGVIQVATGYYHSLAVKSDRTAWAWGYNREGELGDGATINRPTPMPVANLTGVLAVAAGQYHSLGLKSDGTVWAWGWNGGGRLGDGTTTQRTSPVRVVGLTNVIAIAAGQSHSVALRSDGTVWAWGDNAYGGLGDGTFTDRTSPVQVAGLTNAVAIAAAGLRTLALRSDGTVWGWGYNGYGDLGDGSTSYRVNMVRASNLTGVIAIAAGENHSLAVRGDGSVWTWGRNTNGQLGDASNVQRTIPVQVSGFTGGLAVAGGLNFSMALRNDGSIWVWGDNGFGQFGVASPATSTVPILAWAGPVVPAITGQALKFVPVTPCRVADTRNPNGPFGGPAITGGTSRSFVVPSSTCGIPTTAAAYSINATVVPRGLLGYITAWPSDGQLPLASTLNSLDGRVKANAAIVPAAAGNRAISVYATHTTDVILDINGYFVSAATPSTLAFFPLPPCRVADTRSSPGPLAGPFIAGGQSRSFPVRASTCNVPANASAYSLNFTAIPQGPLGYITTWPTGAARPLASTLNAPSGTVTANAAIVPAGTGGQIDVFATNNTDLVIDINGYFAPSGAGGLSLYNLAPCRVLDTREPAGTPPFSGAQSVSVAGSLCTVPQAAQAYVFSATVVPPAPLGYLTLWPQTQTQPLASTLNALDGAVTSNMAIVPTTNGYVDAFFSEPSHLILDISAYFAP